MRRVLPAAAMVALAGCAQVLGIDDLVADRQAAGTSGAAGGAAGGPPGTCSDVCGTPGCGVCPTTPQVEVPHPEHPYAVDGHEVTAGAYRAFLDAGVSPAGQEPSCAYNGSFEPGVVSQAVFDALEAAGMDTTELEEAAASCSGWLASELASFGEQHAIACVDVCDARAYCTWAGKRLCGEITGGMLDVTEGVTEGVHADADRSQWYRACSKAGAQAYPYEGTYQPGLCADAAVSPNHIHDVGSQEGCIGGYAGVVDMSGNVGEWEDACTRFGNPAPLETCLVRGGAYYEGGDGDSGERLACGFFREVLQSSPSSSIGFRCCD
jgi:formylglycine-generating enzyme